MNEGNLAIVEQDDSEQELSPELRLVKGKNVPLEPTSNTINIAELMRKRNATSLVHESAVLLPTNIINADFSKGKVVNTAKIDTDQPIAEMPIVNQFEIEKKDEVTKALALVEPIDTDTLEGKTIEAMTSSYINDNRTTDSVFNPNSAVSKRIETEAITKMAGSISPVIANLVESVLKDASTELANAVQTALMAVEYNPKNADEAINKLAEVGGDAVKSLVEALRKEAETKSAQALPKVA